MQTVTAQNAEPDDHAPATCQTRHRKSSRKRTKGEQGERTAARLLASLGWTCERCGHERATCDIIGRDPTGETWAVEVKNRAIIDPLRHMEQASRNASAIGARWMVMAYLHGTGSWLVLRDGLLPEVWPDGATRPRTDGPRRSGARSQTRSVS